MRESRVASDETIKPGDRLHTFQHFSKTSDGFTERMSSLFHIPEGKMPTLCACGDWHPTRRLPGKQGGRGWHIVASNGIALIFCATCVLAGHRFAQNWTLLGIVVFVQHYATNCFLVGGTRPKRLRRLLRIWQLHVTPRQDFVWISGVNHE